MNKNELAVGDLIEITTSTGERKYCEVQIVDGYGDKEHSFDVCADGLWLSSFQIYPIPLTRDILEKIGFRMKNGKSKHGFLYYGGARIEYMKNTSQSGKVLGVQFIGNGGYSVKTYNLPLPTFVHELQHALRQCKIDYKIEL